MEIAPFVQPPTKESYLGPRHCMRLYKHVACQQLVQYLTQWFSTSVGHRSILQWATKQFGLKKSYLHNELFIP